MKRHTSEVQPFISRLGSVQTVHMSPWTCRATSLFVFHSNVGTDLDKGDSGVYFLHLEAWKGGEGKLKTGFTRFLEMAKQAGGPSVRERGKERLCDSERAEWERDWNLWSTDKEYVLMHEWECLCGCRCVCVCVWLSKRKW